MMTPMVQCWIVRLACIDESSFDFTTKVVGFALHNSTIATYHRMEYDECKTMCYDELQCKSINYSDDMKICEVNSKLNETSNSGDMTERVGFTYMATNYRTKNVSCCLISFISLCNTYLIT